MSRAYSVGRVLPHRSRPDTRRWRDTALSAVCFAAAVACFVVIGVGMLP